MPQIERDYIGTGKVKYVLLDFPIESIHKDAFKAHEAANCAGNQGKYWEMHDRLFAHQNALGSVHLSDHAKAVGLDLRTFEQCLKSGKHEAEIRRNIAAGVEAGVRGTPTFFVGLTDPNDSKIKALEMIRGAQPYAQFKQAIDKLLAPENR